MRPLIIISFIAAVGLLAAVVGVPRSHSGSTDVETSGMPTLRDMHARGADKLPAQEFEDRSLVFHRESKR